MLTAFGKVLRKLRIDRGEILKTMADHLKISSAYLSAIETGKRVIPEDMAARLAQIYTLSEEDSRQLEEAKSQSAAQVKINLNDASPVKRDAALVFARAFDEMDEGTASKLLAFMNKHSRDDG